MERTCQICGAEFKIIKFGHTRKYCFTCSPKNGTSINRMRAARKQAFFLNGDKCNKCGENREYLLDFHHLEKEKKENTISFLIVRGRFKDMFEEIKKCVLLCANCHREFHHLQNTTNLKTEDYVDFSLINSFEQTINYNQSYIVENQLCKICKKPISRNTKNQLCSDCFYRSQRVVQDRPSAKQLIKDIKETSMVATGKKYGVSDNAVRKWLKAYGLPYKTKEIKLLDTSNF